MKRPGYAGLFYFYICNFIQTLFMSKEELKQKIHRLVDEIEDEKILNMLYEDAVEYKTSSDVEDELTDEQWAEIEEGLRQVENGEFMTQEEMLEKFRQWRKLTDSLLVDN